MPSSAAEGKLFFKDWFATFVDQVQTVLDVGPGSGIYCDLIKQIEPVTTIDAVEIFKPYIERFALGEKYDQIFVQDIRKFKCAKDSYDLIILGDVLEHLSYDEAVESWEYLRERTKFIWLSLPVAPFRPWFRGYGHLGQPAIDWAENVHEKHLYEWHYGELIQTLGPFLWQVPFRTVAVMVAEGARK